MERDRRRDHERKTQQYLEDVRDVYVLNESGTLYEPKSDEARDQRHNGQPGANTRSPFHVQVPRDWVAIAISVLTLLLLVVTAHYAYKQWKAMNDTLCEMQKQTANSTAALGEIKRQNDLMKQQIVGTQGAVVRITFDMSSDGKLSIRLFNYGVLTATHIQFTWTADKESLATGKTIGKFLSVTPHISPLKSAIGGNWSEEYLLPWPAPGVPNPGEEMIPNWPGTETIRVFGKLTYDNGVGDRESDTLCKKWFPRYEYRVNKTSRSSGEWGGLVECSSFDTKIASAKKQIKNQYKP